MFCFIQEMHLFSLLRRTLVIGLVVFLKASFEVELSLKATHMPYFINQKNYNSCINQIIFLSILVTKLELYSYTRICNSLILPYFWYDTYVIQIYVERGMY